MGLLGTSNQEKTAFLTTKGIAAKVEEIITGSKKFIWIISPFVDIDQIYLDRLHDAELAGISVVLVFGKNKSLNPKKFENLKTARILFLENLHAKCYINENSALITSMNLYGYSEINNREMGIVAYSNPKKDGIYEDIYNEAMSIIRAAESYDINAIQTKPAPQYNSKQSESKKNTQGYCIRCKTQIDFNMKHPFCKGCYEKWSLYKNKTYKEKFCHACHEEKDGISFAHPLCYDCYIKLKK